MPKSDPFEQSPPDPARQERDQKNIEQATFEEVYPRYEFSELVRLFLALVTWAQRAGHRRTVGTAQPGGKEPAAGPTAKA